MLTVKTRVQVNVLLDLAVRVRMQRKIGHHAEQGMFRRKTINQNRKICINERLSPGDVYDGGR